MNDEQIQRAIEFLIESQAEAAAQNAIFRESIREGFKELQARDKVFLANQERSQANQERFQASQERSQASQERFEANQKKFQENGDRLDARIDCLHKTVQGLAVLGRDLVTVAQMHSRRLDLLEGIPPH